MIDFNNIDFTAEEALVQIQSVIYNCTDPQSIREKINDILNRYIDQFKED